METLAEKTLIQENAPAVRKIFSVSAAHLFNDWYMNYIQTLLPFLVAAGLSISKCGFLVSAFTVTSSVSQPIFGYLVDKKNQRWMVYAGTLWMAALLGIVGLIHNYFIMLFTVALAGLGTAAFHPQASAMISSMSGNRKGLFQSIFSAAGNIGWAFTPLLVVPFIQAYGLKSTPVLIIPGIIVAFILWLDAPRSAAKKAANPVSTWSILKANFETLFTIISVVVFRSLAYFGLVAFLPLYFKSKNISMTNSSYFLFIMLFCGALGGLLGGHLSDKIGRKKVIVNSLILSTPLFCLFLISQSPFNYVFLALAGAALLASFSVTVVVAQEILSKSEAMASGLMLGFSVGMGGLGVGLMGIVAQHYSVSAAVLILVFMPAIAGVLGLKLKCS